MENDKPFRAFNALHEAYWRRDGDRHAPDICIGRYYEDRSCEYEFTLEWHKFDSRDSPSLKVTLWHGESMQAIADFAELFAWLAATETQPSPRQVQGFLTAIGCVDMTERYNPREDYQMTWISEVSKAEVFDR